MVSFKIKINFYVLCWLPDFLFSEGISDEEKNYFHIKEEDGTVSIGAIDRDTYQHNTYNLEINAVECDDPNSVTPTNISIVVQDKNDKWPIICALAAGNENSDPNCSDKIEISLEEEKPSTLSSFYTINIKDPDEVSRFLFFLKRSVAKYDKVKKKASSSYGFCPGLSWL